jgi:hypothetical protein
MVNFYIRQNGTLNNQFIKQNKRFIAINHKIQQ